jgi:hypothetical protein
MKTYGKVLEVTPDRNTAPLLAGAQFADAFCMDIDGAHLDARRAAVLMTSRSPRWIEALVQLRHMVVAPLGLKISAESASPRRQAIGLFPVLTEAPDRMVAGFDDKHLDFRVVIDVVPPQSASSQQVTVTTLVKTHNLFGRIYLATIMPFHRLIVPAMLRKVALDQPIVIASEAKQSNLPL